METRLYKKLKAVPEVTAVQVVTRSKDDGDELWLFVVSQQQLEPDEEALILTLLASASDMSARRCGVFQLSSLPVTRSGRTMRRQLEKFVNHLAVPNRLQMRNPEVLEEIVRVIGVAGVDDQTPSVPKLSTL
jgi:acyl-coenzyme A synthetase/AMP-(fatty) acid ligase